MLAAHPLKNLIPNSHNNFTISAGWWVYYRCVGLADLFYNLGNGHRAKLPRSLIIVNIRQHVRKKTPERPILLARSS